MTLQTFHNVISFQVFVPEKSGWLRYRASWANTEVWHCEFTSQDGNEQRQKLITKDYAENIWERFKGNATCETQFMS